MPRREHPNKDVERALKHAEDEGFTVDDGLGHWGVLKCPYYGDQHRCGAPCQTGIWGTPKNPGNHAKQLRRAVDNCKVHKGVKTQHEQHRANEKGGTSAANDEPANVESRKGEQ